MRKSLKQFKGMLVVAHGKLVSLDGHRVCLRQVSINSFFSSFKEMMLLPVPDNFFILSFEQHILINKKGIPENILMGDYIRFVGRVYEYTRKDGSVDYSIDDIKWVQKIDKEQHWKTDALSGYCLEHCKHYNECAQRLLDICQELEPEMKAAKEKKEFHLNNGFWFIPMYNLRYIEPFSFYPTNFCSLRLYEIAQRAGSISYSIALSYVLDEIDTKKQKEQRISLSEEEFVAIKEKYDKIRKKHWKAYETGKKEGEYINKKALNTFIDNHFCVNKKKLPSDVKCED